MRKKITTREFIEKAKQIHADKYDYSKTEYVNSQTKVCIICPEHGEFWQTPNSHLKGCGCFKCGVKRSAEGHLSDTDNFTKKAKFIFGESYDYSFVNYEKSSKKILLKCNKCGNLFFITPNRHLQGQGCPICAKEKKGPNKKNTEEYIINARKVHGNKYDYSKVEYVNWNVKICIICPEHGEFWQIPGNHLQGQGCPKCRQSKLENDIEKLLIKNGIKHIHKYTNKSLGKQHLDFYLPDYNVAIECQGKQHIYQSYFGGNRFNNIEEQLTHIKKLDETKKLICDNLNIKLLYFISDDIKEKDLLTNNIYTIDNSFWNKENLLERIKNSCL